MQRYPKHNSVCGVVPEYWSTAVSTLKHRDSLLTPILSQYGERECLESRGDPFSTLMRSIIGQQISVKAADSIWERWQNCYGEPAPTSVLKIRKEGLRECGLSGRKADYILALATNFLANKIDLRILRAMADEDIITKLSGFSGIGRWTVEMFLIFCLLRPDIMPLNDVGLARAISDRYNDGHPVDQSDMTAISERWRPWRTVAVWHLWRSLDPVPVSY